MIARSWVSDLLPAGMAAFASVTANETETVVRIQSLTSSPVTRRSALALSHLGEHALSWTAIGLSAAVLDRRQRQRWLRATLAVVTAHGVSIVAKRVARRHRPADPRIQVLVGTPSNWSFPSSHAASTTAAAVAFSALLGPPYPLLAVPAMAASRVILGVHYPSDVLAGVVVGAVIGRRAGRSQPACRLGSRS